MAGAGGDGGAGEGRGATAIGTSQPTTTTTATRSTKGAWTMQFPQQQQQQQQQRQQQLQQQPAALLRPGARLGPQLPAKKRGKNTTVQKVKRATIVADAVRAGGGVDIVAMRFRQSRGW